VLGNTTSTTAADHIAVTRKALTQLPDLRLARTFVYECDPTDGDGFDFFSSDVANVVLLRSGSVGLACMILDGQQIENGLTPAHPLLGATTLAALSAVYSGWSPPTPSTGKSTDQFGLRWTPTRASGHVAQPLPRTWRFPVGHDIHPQPRRSRPGDRESRDQQP